MVQEGERLEIRLMRMLKGALSPHVTDYRLEVQYGGGDEFDIVDKVTEGINLPLEVPEVANASASTNAQEANNSPISLFNAEANPDADAPPAADDKTVALLPNIKTSAILQAPQRLPALFAFQRTTVYLLLSPRAIQKNPTAVVLRGTSPQGPLELRIAVELLLEKGTSVHALAARRAVQDLEEGRGWVHDARDSKSGELLEIKLAIRFQDIVKNEAVRLGTTFQVANHYCSFVAVQTDAKRSSKEVPTTRIQAQKSDDVASCMEEDEDSDENSDEDLGYGCFDSDGPSAVAALGLGEQFKTPQKVSRDSRYAAMSSLRLHPDMRFVLGSRKRAGPDPDILKPYEEEIESTAKSALPIEENFDLYGSPLPKKAWVNDFADNECSSIYFVRAGSHTQCVISTPNRGPSGRGGGRGGQAQGSYRGRGGGALQSSQSGFTTTFATSNTQEDESSAPKLQKEKKAKVEDMNADKKFRELIRMQDFDGWWESRIRIAKLIGLDVDEIFWEKTTEAEGRAWASVLVLTFFKTRVGKEEEIWEMIVEKARL
ncbi:MAG: hypothetical protein MMC23_009116 [Stictis urceolatum]|nr:hypothetical protein [Stictis urceolata]